MIARSRHTRLVALLTICTVGVLQPLVGQDAPTLNDPSSSDVFSGSGSLIDGVETICYILGAICAMVGAVVSYTSFIDGEEDLLPGIRNWFGSCLALIIFPYIIRQLAGV